MIILKKKTEIMSCKKSLIIFLMIFIASVHLIQSQNTLTTISPDWFQQERLIKYEQLNEVLKLANYKSKSEKRDSIQKRQISIQDSIISAQRVIIERYETRVIHSLKEQIRLYESQLSHQLDLNNIRNEKWELKYDKLKSKRLGFSIFAGYGYAEKGFMPMVGLGVSYTVFRL